MLSMPAATDASSPTSTRSVSALPSTPSRVAASVVSLRPEMMTCAPARASSRQIAAPTAPPPPVTQATLPDSPSICRSPQDSAAGALAPDPVAQHPDPVDLDLDDVAVLQPAVGFQAAAAADGARADE